MAHHKFCHFARTGEKILRLYTARFTVESVACSRVRSKFQFDMNNIRMWGSSKYGIGDWRVLHYQTHAKTPTRKHTRYISSFGLQLVDVIVLVYDWGEGGGEATLPTSRRTFRFSFLWKMSQPIMAKKWMLFNRISFLCKLLWNQNSTAHHTAIRLSMFCSIYRPF